MEALELLKQVKNQAVDGELLIGVDLMKAASILMDAYDDPLKVTTAFNLNILRSINSYLGSNFRVELYLETLEDLMVSWPGKSRFFKQVEVS
jgi:uncharacterized SAM-dependent methyltransferase